MQKLDVRPIECVNEVGRVMLTEKLHRSLSVRFRPPIKSGYLFRMSWLVGAISLFQSKGNISLAQK